MKVIGPDKTFIDYFQSAYVLQRGLKTSFGIRVQAGLCWSVMKIDDGAACACGQEFALPLKLKNLPNHVRMIVEDHLLNYPKSDPMDVLLGQKSFQDSLETPEPREMERSMTANQKIRLPDAS